MKTLVLDNIGSFSLVPFLKESLPGELVSMARIDDEHMWSVFKNVRPDVVFVDFCNENAVNLTKRIWELSRKPKIVIRLHGYEAQSWFMESIEWDWVSDLIVVSPKFKEIVDSKNVLPESQIHVVPNGINLEKFKLQRIEEMDNKTIAYAGYLNKKKGPALLRTVMASMADKKFHVAGTFQDEQVRLYMQCKQFENVTYHGWVKTEEFLKGKRFILSTSVTESFGMSIGEGMAMGLTPLVHSWPGADEIWPEECIWTTIDELKDISPQGHRWCRKWVEDRYSMDNCVKSVVDLLTK